MHAGGLWTWRRNSIHIMVYIPGARWFKGWRSIVWTIPFASPLKSIDCNKGHWLKKENVVTPFLESSLPQVSGQRFNQRNTLTITRHKPDSISLSITFQTSLPSDDQGTAMIQWKEYSWYASRIQYHLSSERWSMIEIPLWQFDSNSNLGFCGRTQTASAMDYLYWTSQVPDIVEKSSDRLESTWIELNRNR